MTLSIDDGIDLFTHDKDCLFTYDLSNGTDEAISNLLTPRYVEIMYLYILPAVLAVGVTGNLAFVFVVFRLRRMRTVTNFYLVNLAFADICCLLTGVIEKLVRTVKSPIYGDQASCIIVYSLLDTASFASLFLVTLVTAEKFYAVCFPLKHRRITGRARTIKLAVSCWCLAAAFAASLLPSYWLLVFVCISWPQSALYTGLPPYVGTCYPVNDIAVDLAHGIQTIPFFLAVILNIVMYFKIIRTLHSRVAVSGELKCSKENSLRMRNQMSRMLVVNGTLFFILAAPFHVLSVVILAASLKPDTPDSLSRSIDVAVPSCQLLLYMNSAVNPFVYSAANSRYRRAYRQAFCQRGLKVGIVEKEVVRAPQPNANRMNAISGRTGFS